MLSCLPAIRFAELKERVFGFSETPDGVVYSNFLVKLPAPLLRLIGFHDVRPDLRQRRYGRIRAQPLCYITGPMLIITILVVYAAVAGFPLLVIYFNTNIYLNGLIISLMIFAILKAYHNSFLIFRTACFFRRMERIIARDLIGKDDVVGLRRALEKEGALVNTSTMEQAIDNIERFGHPNFTDHSARLIKSKLGFRVNKNRGNVAFIAGMLVMLGLLGTFLGLLKTIDAVGQAMNSMANIGGDGGEVGMEQMTGFIGSLAAPLQGMGLAFSTSLFGLSGSLLIGFFLHLTGTPQNAFMENVSRWLDDRIIKFKPEQTGTKEASGHKKPTDDDLKEWLAGFVYLSQKTHSRLNLIAASFGALGDGILETNAMLKRLGESQCAMVEDVKAVKDHVVTISGHQQNMILQTQSVCKTLDEIRGQGSDIRGGMIALLDNGRSVAEGVRGVGEHTGAMVAYQKEIQDCVRKIDGGVGGIAGDIRDLRPGLTAISQSQEIIAGHAQNMSSELQLVCGQSKVLNGHVASLLDHSVSMDARVGTLCGQNEDLARAMPEIGAKIADLHGQLSGINRFLEGHFADNQENANAVLESLATLESLLDGIERRQTNLLSQHSSAQETRQSDIRTFELKFQTLASSLQSNVERLADIKSAIDGYVKADEKNAQAALQSLVLVERTLRDIASSQEKLLSLQSRETRFVHANARAFEAALKEASNNLNDTYADLLEEVRRLLARLESDPNMKQAESMVLQLKSVLRDLSKKKHGLGFRKDKN